LKDPKEHKQYNFSGQGQKITLPINWGEAAVFGTSIRRFESCRPSHMALFEKDLVYGQGLFIYPE
jgi:hypothetical protein